MTLVLEEEQIYSNFINSLRSPKTKQNYTSALKQYMRFHGLENYSQLVSMSNFQIFEAIKSFILDLVNRRSSTSNINMCLAALKNFYEMNDIEDIKWNKLKRFRGEETAFHEDRRYMHEEIHTLLNVCDLRMKVAVLLLASSGMRVGALHTLKVSDLVRKEDLYKINIYKGLRGKGKYFTFCTPECAKAIDTYLQFRERCGEKIGPNSPLLRKDFDTELQDARNHVYPCGDGAIRKSIDSHLILAGLKIVDHVSKNNRKEVKMTHGFRKFFRTQLILGKVDPDLRELLLGHSAKDLRLIYTRMTEDEILAEYEKAIDCLTISDENRLRTKVEKLEVEKNKYEALAAEIESLKQKINSR